MSHRDSSLIGSLALIVKKGCILLIKRGIEPHFRYWSLPGGVIDDLETAQAAAERETREETGLEVKVIKKLGTVKGPITGKKHAVFLCLIVGGALNPCLPEVLDVQWISYDNLSEIHIPNFLMSFLSSIDLISLEE